MEEESTKLIIYHKGCTDGWTAAWIMYYHWVTDRADLGGELYACSCANPDC